MNCFRWHIISRFFPNGVVLSLLANEEMSPQQIIPILKPTLRMKAGFHISIPFVMLLSFSRVFPLVYGSSWVTRSNWASLTHTKGCLSHSHRHSRLSLKPSSCLTRSIHANMYLTTMHPHRRGTDTIYVRHEARAALSSSWQVEQVEHWILWFS